MNLIWACQGAFVLFWLLERRIQYRRRDRRYQYFVGYLTALLSLLGLIFLPNLFTLLSSLLPQWLSAIGLFANRQWGVSLPSLLGLFPSLGGVSLTLVFPYALNALLLLVFLAIKPALLWLSKRLCLLLRLYEPGRRSRYYRHEAELDGWLLEDHCLQLRSLFSVLHWALFVLPVLLNALLVLFPTAAASLYPPYPVLAVLTLNAVFDFLNGYSRNEYLASIGAEDEGSVTNRNYDLLRPILRRLFGDRLLHEGVREASSFAPIETNEEIIRALIASENDVERVYGRYLENRVLGRRPIESSYARSAVQIMQGQSVLFATPFYRDLSDYLFYPMFMNLLRRRRCMVVIGRDGIDSEVAAWVEEGLARVSNAPAMWRIRFLQDYRYQPDVIIVPLKEIHNVPLFDEARTCLREVSFVLLLEPSRMIARGQIGLKLLTSLCSQDPPTVFCSTDVNHDGLVDTLSHLLRTSILNVSATHAKASACSEMLWDADGPYLHHRILTGISHYLGVGTELGLVALKNQIPRVEWKSASAFPVLDMRWIMQQYYGPICDYLKYPRNQHALDTAFCYSDNLWDLDADHNGFYIVEDELSNLFETLRQYASHISEHGFINILSPNYLLRDYMQHNAALFLSDPKAIPSFAPEHASTRRNCFLGLVMRMLQDSLPEDAILRELRLIGIETPNVLTALNEMVQDYLGIDPAASPVVSSAREVLAADELSTEAHIFYSIRDDRFTTDFLRMLRSAYYIAEDGQGERYYLGSRLWGHVYQRYLPGQFYTFGGKYYEIYTISPEHGVMVRRAADHLTGRRYYRQIREYEIRNAVPVRKVAGQHTLQDIRVTNLHADLCIRTAGYYELQRYDDMATARRTEISGLPERLYVHKHFLRVELPGASPAVCQTLCMLLNEIFATTFPLSREYIAAVCPDAQDQRPEISTYTVSGDTGSQCINLIEDSPIDLGLLTSVERNLPRLLEIAADYIAWHLDMLRPLDSAAEPALDFTPLPELEPEEGEEPDEHKRGWLSRLWESVRKAWRRLWHRGERPPKVVPAEKEPLAGHTEPYDTPAEPESDAPPASDAAPDSVAMDAPAVAQPPMSTAEPAPAPDSVPRAYGEDAPTTVVNTGETLYPPEKEVSPAKSTEAPIEPLAEPAQATVPPESESTLPVKKQTPNDVGATLTQPNPSVLSDVPVMQEISETGTPSEALPAPLSQTSDAQTAPSMPEGSSSGDTSTDENPTPTSAKPENVKPSMPAPGTDTPPAFVEQTEPVTQVPKNREAKPMPRKRASTKPKSTATAPAVPPAPGKRKPKTDALRVPAEQVTLLQHRDNRTSTPSDVPNLTQLARISGPQRSLLERIAQAAREGDGASGLFCPPPYAERAFLNFGGSKTSDRLALEESLAYLQRYRFTESALSQARAQQHIAKALEEAYNPRRKDVHFCDFCGCELTAIEYDVLQDGRERCMSCGKTAVRTLDDFKRLFLQVRERMETLYGIHIKVPVVVRMISAEEMGRRIGKELTPTPGYDERAIGVAIRRGNKHTLYIENGAPRMSAASTIAHELTHIWQYLNWDERQIKRHYGARNAQTIYEGMAVWASIQYLILIGEPAYAKRVEINERLREDVYGVGFRLFLKKYPLVSGTCLTTASPFHTEDNKPI